MIFLLKYWPYILSAVILLATILYIAHLRSTNAELRAEIAQNLANIAIQNTAVEQLQQDAAKRLQAAQTALQAAQKASAIHKRSAQEILQRPQPIDRTACESADALINQFLK